MLQPKPNTLYYGDCLQWMAEWPSGFVDLIYLDPPFNSKRDYNVFLRGAPEEQAQFRAFTDTWHWDEKAVERYQAVQHAFKHPLHAAMTGFHTIIGECGMLAYLTYMGERLLAMKRLLADTGCIWLHCDPTASHYLKLLADAVFGDSLFRNEIVWCYPPGGKGPKYGFHRKHDVIFYYGMSEKKGTFNREYSPLTDTAIAKFTSVDEDGRRYKEYPGGRSYLDESPGRPVPDWWTDIHSLGQAIGKENTGYPTQKPVALLERIIKTSSNPGDLVLDPFCGCGTTLVAAEQANRNWLGIDISSNAVRLIRDERLGDKRISMEGIPADMAGAEALAADQPFQFERWAVELLPGFAPNAKQVGDGGVDGQGLTADSATSKGGKQTAVLQVKGGSPKIDQLRAFGQVIGRQQAAFGIFLTLRKWDSASARAEAAGMGKVQVGEREYPVLQLWSVQEYFASKMPAMPTMLNPYTGKPIHGDLFD